MLDSLQLDIGCINTDGGVDGQSGHEFSPSLCEDRNKFKKFSFPNGPRKKFDGDLFPDTTRSGNDKLKPGLYSLEICITSICALLDVLCDVLAEPLQSSFDCLAIGSDLLEIIHTT